MSAIAAKKQQPKAPLSKTGALRQILEAGSAGTQEELREQLFKLGFDLNQSTISRMLRKLGAVKRVDENGATIYRLAEEAALPPPAQASIADLILDIAENGSLIVIHTSAGSASLIARHLDHYKPGGILGTIAGDDTIFVAPASSAAIPQTLVEIRRTLID